MICAYGSVFVAIWDSQGLGQNWSSLGTSKNWIYAVLDILTIFDKFGGDQGLCNLGLLLALRFSEFGYILSTLYLEQHWHPVSSHFEKLERKIKVVAPSRSFYGGFHLIYVYL